MARNHNGRRSNSSCKPVNSRSAGNSQRSGKPKGSNNRYQSKDVEGEVNSKQGNNDPNWYFADKGLMESVSKFSFNNFLGYGDGVGQNKVPYALQIYFNPAAACGMDPVLNDSNRQAGINMASLKLFTTLSSQSGKTTNYGPEDLSILMLALGDLISFVEYGRRTLGLAFVYNNRNWNYPVNMIKACGFTSDVLNNLAQKRADFNVTLNTINKISFPSNVAYFYKCANMYQNIFLDSTSPMAQSYVYIPNSVWILDEKMSGAGSVLKSRNLWNTSSDMTMTWDNYMSILNDMVNAIMQSSTFNYIYGDVLNYAAKSNVPLLHLDIMAEDYATMPVYNELALSQIHNLTATGSPMENQFYSDVAHTVQANTPANNVYADAATNSVRYAPVFAYHPLQIADLYIDSLTPDPDVNVRIDMTRYAVRADSTIDLYTADSATPKGKGINNAALPDHYVTYMRIMHSSGYSKAFSNIMKSEGMGFVEPAALLSQFDWAPILYVSDEADPKSDFYMFGDLDYFTTLDRGYLAPVNDLAYQGLFELR